MHCSRVSSEGNTGSQQHFHLSQLFLLQVDLTQQDLQSIGVQVQSLCLLLYHIHLLCLLVVVGVDAGVGQHLQAVRKAQVTQQEANVTNIVLREVPFELVRELYKHR